MAGPFTGLYVFGDSLSDTGNTSASTFGLQPGGGYFSGRFSNGPVYAERLAEGLGLGPLVRSGAGGTGYAFGGAETDGPGGFTGLLLNSLVEQVDDFLGDLGGVAADAGALYVVFIGANDLFGGQTDVSIPVAETRTQIERLIGAGARNLLGINLPLLGLTPDFNGDAASAAEISSRTVAFNSQLADAYDAIELLNPAVTIDRLDLADQISDLVTSPASWGFTNVVNRGQDIAGGTLDAPGYLFWDGVHPTREAHALLGEAAIRAVLPAGDYDRDGLVTASDLGVWSGGFGAAFNALAGATTGIEADANGDGLVDAADYTVWRDNLSISSASQAVPEPASLALLLPWALLLRARKNP